jgi:exodeoxyribonuclease VII large subunit
VDLLDDDDLDAPLRRSNAPELSVSELASAVKRTVEGEFSFVRVRGEVGRVARPGSGHLYFDLKDDRASLAAIVWKGQASRLTVRPEEGMEVVATGRLTTFPGQSKYQMSVDDLAPAGAGALMAQLEARRAKLAGEGLFDAARKRPIPYLPEVIAVVTSPSGAVIRDILHRLRDRFPRRVLVWPVAVQGAACPGDVARAVAGLNALAPGGPVPVPDLIIVARGGGSIEDLWGFNDEGVARAVAASRIPVISAVGHETDTTLIDLAADLRAPTPTAAAEMAVPVRADLHDRLASFGLRGSGALRTTMGGRLQRLQDLARALPRPEALLGAPGQRLDALASRLPRALKAAVGRQRVRLAELRPSTALLARGVRDARRRVAEAEASLRPAVEVRTGRARERLDAQAVRLKPAAAARVLTRVEQLGRVVARLSPDLPRAVGRRLADALASLDRQRVALGYEETLRRGFAVVRAEGRPVTRAADARGHAQLDVQFADGTLALRAPALRKARAPGAPDQGSLL